MLRDDSKVGLRRPLRNSGLEMAHEKPEAIEAERRRCIRLTGFFWNPEIGIAPSKTRWHNADQRPSRAIQDKSFVQDGGIRIESVDPHLVAQDKNRWRTGLIVRGLHYSPDEGRHTKKLESARRNITAAEAVGALARSVEHVAAVIGDDSVKDVILSHVVQKLRAAIAAPPARLILFGVMDLDRNEVLRIGVGKRLHQDVLDDTEDGGRGADAQGKSNHRHNSEARAFPKVSSRVTEILPK